MKSTIGILAINGGNKTRVKPFPTGAHIGDEERARVKEVLDSGILSGFIAQPGDRFLGGKQVKELEALIDQYFGSAHAVTCNSATAALHMAVAALGIAPGDEVIVTPYSMSASATAILMQGAVPVFADIDPVHFCLDPQAIERAITPRTRAILLVHLFGKPADMDGIMKIAHQHKLAVIEDCAQAPGAMYKGRFVGTFGDIGIFSLNQNKTITCGEGGWAITQNAELALRMQLVRNHGEVVVEGMKVERIDNIIGYNYRMTELEAAVAIGQFRRLDQLNDHRIELAGYLSKQLEGLPGITVPKKEQQERHVYFVYPIRFDEVKTGISRDIFIKALNAEGIPCAGGYVRPIYWEPLYQKKIAFGKKGYPFIAPVYEGSVDYSKGICPVCERMHQQELVLLPVCRYPNTLADMDDVTNAIKKVLSNVQELKKGL